MLSKWFHMYFSLSAFLYYVIWSQLPQNQPNSYAICGFKPWKRYTWFRYSSAFCSKVCWTISRRATNCTSQLKICKRSHLLQVNPNNFAHWFYFSRLWPFVDLLIGPIDSIHHFHWLHTRFRICLVSAVYTLCRIHLTYTLCRSLVFLQLLDTLGLVGEKKPADNTCFVGFCTFQTGSRIHATESTVKTKKQRIWKCVSIS